LFNKHLIVIIYEEKKSMFIYWKYLWSRFHFFFSLFFDTWKKIATKTCYSFKFFHFVYAYWVTYIYIHTHFFFLGKLHTFLTTSIICHRRHIFHLYSLMKDERYNFNILCNGRYQNHVSWKMHFYLICYGRY